MTLLAEKTAAVNETEAVTSERNGRSSDSFGIQYNFSSSQKRGLPVKSCSTGLFLVIGFLVTPWDNIRKTKKTDLIETL